MQMLKHQNNVCIQLKYVNMEVYIHCPQTVWTQNCCFLEFRKYTKVVTRGGEIHTRPSTFQMQRRCLEKWVVGGEWIAKQSQKITDRDISKNVNLSPDFGGLGERGAMYVRKYTWCCFMYNHYRIRASLKIHDKTILHREIETDETDFLNKYHMSVLFVHVMYKLQLS